MPHLFHFLRDEEIYSQQIEQTLENSISGKDAEPASTAVTQLIFNNNPGDYYNSQHNTRSNLT